MKRLAEILVANRFVLIGLFLVVGAFSGLGLRHLGFSFSIIPLLEANAEVRAEVDRYLEELPPQDYDQLLILERGEVLNAADLVEVEALRRDLEALPGVARVVALSNIEVVDARGMIPRMAPFAEVVGERSLLEAVARHPLLERRLLSDDGRATAMMVIAARDFDAEDLGLLERLERRVPELLQPGWRPRFIGDEVARRAMTAHMKSDLGTSLLFQALFFALLLPFIFRSVRGIVLPLTVVATAEVLCLGLLAWCGRTIGLIDLAVPGIIMMIAICDSVHMIQRFEESLAEGLKKRDAVIDMLRHVGFACFQTSITTAIGFLSLAAARHQVVQSFGLVAAMAVMLTFVCVLLLLPALLAIWPVRRAIPPRIPGLALGGYGRRGPAFLVTAAVFAVALFGISRVKIDSRWLEELPPDEAIVQDLHWFETHFAGIMLLDVKVTGDLSDPANLRALQWLELEILAEDGVGHAESPVDWVLEAAGNPAEPSDGDLGRGLAFLQLGGDRFPRHVLRPDLQAGRIVFRTRDDGTRRFFALRERVDELAQKLPEGLHVEVAGFLEMAHESSRMIATTMLESFGLSLIAISLLIALIYRSWRIGLAAVIPNIMPIAIALGVNGLFDIPVRIGIVMIYSLGLGLAVDDSIHLTSRFLEERRKPGNARRALEAALRSSGSALLTTSLVLTVGALCYLPSGFRSLHDVGVLLTIIVVSALAFDLFLLPHLLEIAVKDDEMTPDDQSRVESKR